MRITVRHDTVYRYSAPALHSTQLLRLTPRAEARQNVVSWRITAPARLTPTTDAFGNRAHLLVVAGPHSEIRIGVSGVVEVAPSPEPGWIAQESDERIPPMVFLVPTRLTEVTPEIAELAATALREAPREPECFLDLAAQIERTLVYRPGITVVSSTAAQALAHGYGVCQDHAHLYIACCRARNVPARYVSGYVDTGDVPEGATHAWVDVWVEGRGWLSIDVTHIQLSADRYCRLAVGRDYDSAAPLRGVRTGGGEEEMAVDVRVNDQ